MGHPSQKEKAEALRRLHHAGRVLVLVNVWDVIAARVVEEMGAPALATTSAGVANSLGYPDGQRISRGEMLEAVQRIARAVLAPVTADMEAGYANSAESMAETAQQLVETGAVGLNLEDGAENESRLIDVKLAVEKITAVRETGTATGVPLVINARTDAYWVKGGNVPDRFAETVRRAQAYRQAGADCIFVPGLRDAAEIARFLKESPGPLNVLGGAGALPVPELQKLGVARVSVGGGPARAALGILRKIVEELNQSGTYTTIAKNAFPSAEANRMLQERGAVRYEGK